MALERQHVTRQKEVSICEELRGICCLHRGTPFIRVNDDR